jgi:hypothetical protein
MNQLRVHLWNVNQQAMEAAMISITRIRKEDVGQGSSEVEQQS